MENFKFDLTDELMNVLSVVLEDYSYILEHVGYHFRRNNILNDCFMIDVITLRQEFDIQSTLYVESKTFEDGNKSVSEYKCG